MLDPALAQVQRRLQAQIAAALAMLGINHDTNGNDSARLWNFAVNLGPVETRPAVEIPVTIVCVPRVVGALVALQPLQPFDDIRLDIHELLAPMAMLRFQAHVEGVDLVFLRTDVVWIETPQAIFPPQAVAALWQAVVAAWIAVDTKFPGRFALVEAEVVPQSTVMLLTPTPPNQQQAEDTTA